MPNPKKPRAKCKGCDNNCLHRNATFCSQACHLAYRRSLKIDDILKGRAGPTATKRYLIESRGHKCEICEVAEWLGGPVPLVMDHISGNSDDNSQDNLRLVCPNCDALLPTFKAKNRGKGRAYRRARYAEGKSY